MLGTLRDVAGAGAVDAGTAIVRTKTLTIKSRTTSGDGRHGSAA